MATTLGIDIGKRSVRGALIRTGLRNHAIERYVEIPISPMTDESPRAAVQIAVEELMSKVGHVDSVVANLDGMQASLRSVTLPLATKKRAAEVLPFELDSLLPFDIEEAVIDFQEVEDRDSSAVLLAAAAPERAVAETLSGLEAMGVHARELAVGAAALDGLLAFVPQPRHEAWMLVHLDADTTDVCIVRNERAELCRTFDEGSLSLEQGARRVHASLHQTLMKYRADGGPVLDKLIVMGDGATDRGLVQSLADSVQAPAEALSLPATAEGLEGASPVFGKALALSGRTLRRGKRIDLRKGRFALPGGMIQLRKYAALIAACAAGLFASYMFSVWAQLRVISEERDALASRLESISEQAFGEATKSPLRARELLEGGGIFKSPLPGFDAFDALAAISDAVPKEVVHDTRKLEITLDEGEQTGKFELAGQIPDLAARDRVAEALASHECIDELERGKTSTAPGQDRKNYALEGVIACPGAGRKPSGKKSRAK